jgi:hypothetical protein
MSAVMSELKCGVFWRDNRTPWAFLVTLWCHRSDPLCEHLTSQEGFSPWDSSQVAYAVPERARQLGCRELGQVFWTMEHLAVRDTVTLGGVTCETLSPLHTEVAAQTVFSLSLKWRGHPGPCHLPSCKYMTACE